MRVFRHKLKTLTYVTRILANGDLRFVLPLILANYTYLRLQRLLEMQLRLKSVPDEALQAILSLEPTSESYVDSYSCVLASKELFKTQTALWYYICTASSPRKYKVTVAASESVASDVLLVSDTTLFNIQNHLNVDRDSKATRYFISKIFLSSGLDLLSPIPFEQPRSVFSRSVRPGQRYSEGSWSVTDLESSRVSGGSARLLVSQLFFGGSIPQRKRCAGYRCGEVCARTPVSCG